MTITGQSSLAKDEIDRMVRDADAHAEEDRRRREEADVRNTADTLVYQTEKLLGEQGDKVGPDQRTRVEDGLKALKEALSGPDLEAIRRATDALVATSQDLSRQLYEQAGAAAGDGAAGQSPGDGQRPSDDEVVDAEIVDDHESA